jgi:hypothetical protein
MQTTRQTPRATRLAALIATLSLGVSASCFAAVAGSGEAQDMALPNYQPQAQQTQLAASDLTTPDTVAATSTGDAWNPAGPLTREQVRADLQAARANGTLSRSGEVGDAGRVLAAREAANREQTENIMAQYRAEQERDIALAQAEAARTQIETEGGLEYMLSAAPWEDGSERWEAVDASYEVSQARIDVIRMNLNTLPTNPEEELVVVAIEGGDPHEQEQRAMAIREHFAAMGIDSDRIYIEAAQPA